ncbi:uncharacterized protein LOC131298624 [Rhododendron vialii]|uniref:uncharacterized protein LOC131298624 n=1 Tax=Rhododendron vialii TaxID=182163 RepID=UPI00265E20F5|nr:uncharacterized protein LOC131298624 [Rhododendron vialii]
MKTFEPPWSITFTEQDLQRIQTPYSNALVVKVQISTHSVKRVLVDQGSSAGVMYLSLFTELEIPESCLLPAEVPLIGFSGTPVWPLGRITLPVVTGSVTSNLEFVVVDAPSPYNAILGRNWLHSIKVVASTYHQVVRQCYVSAIGKTSSSKRVHWVEVPDKPVLEDVGSLPEEKSIEDLIKFPLNEDASRYFMLGADLPKAGSEETFQFLKSNIEVFAWTLYDMPGIDPELIQHSLNVSKSAKLVIQKPRCSATIHAEAVNEEVDKLLKAGAIKEVQYPTWLANPVVDCLPLPKTDQLVDATAGHARLSFLDAYRGYHQIAMDPADMEKMAFITPRGLFCYLVMPFGLKNAGATFQRMVYLLFGMLIGEIMEAYIDDMVVESLKAENHLSHLAEVFAILKKYKLRLNADKCAFGVSSGKFLGYLVTRRGIEADPNQISAIQPLKPPSTPREIQKLTGMAAALNRREGLEDQPIYFTSRTLLPAQTRYLLLEKLLLALVTAARKLLPYFQEHPIIVLTEFPLKNLLRKADLSSRVSQWAVELANFDIHFEPRTAIKAQVLADSIAEFTPGSPDEEALVKPNCGMLEQQEARKTWNLFSGDVWKLHVDGASNNIGAGAGVVLVNPCGILHESAITINFPATKNEAEYEALLAGLRAAISLQVEDLQVFCDSQLIVNQITGDYEAWDPRMIKYQATAFQLIRGFKGFHIEQINRENNAHADALASLASVSKASEYRHISLGEIHQPSFEISEEVLSISLGPSWMDEIVSFLKNDTLPSDKKEAHCVRSKAAHYWISEHGQLYRKSFTGPYLRVIHPTEVPTILTELHSGSCGCHSGGRSLCQRALSQGYFWKGMKKDCEEFLITATDYFSKWVEAKPLVTTTEADVRRFVWRNIVTRFGVPYAIVSDNGSQFVGKELTGLCAEFRIRFFNSTPSYPQGNGQAEATNKTVCAGIKRRLHSKRGKWAEELPRVL